MPEVALWEQILVGVFALLLLLFFGPAVRRVFKETRSGTFSEWMGVITPLAIVVAFVILLVAIARS